ncbi:MAG: TerD family protein [Clostridiales bacterium]|jgi:stress response protein SCP2|uniref:TerD family protein n=1 Tax=Aminipila sp. TaxID=2060095 RepID=UPI001DEAAF88|nr:TerD family protein [Aminipila sp.]MBE6035764.1 TerD family protein [Clostridiales bacterium]
MTVSLQKGQKISLTKENAALNRIMVGLGWDEVPQPKGGFFAPKPQSIDCDASVFMLTGGKLQGNKDIVYFGNLQHSSRSVQHMGDNLTGAGDGDDEQILVELSKVPEQYDRIIVVVNIYQALQRKQHFGMIQNAFCRVVDDKNQELCRYSLTEDYSGMTSLIFGEIYRHNGEWKFNAMGQGTNDPGLKELVQRFM